MLLQYSTIYDKIPYIIHPIIMAMRQFQSNRCEFLWITMYVTDNWFFSFFPPVNYVCATVYAEVTPSFSLIMYFITIECDISRAKTYYNALAKYLFIKSNTFYFQVNHLHCRHRIQLMVLPDTAWIDFNSM